MDELSTPDRNELAYWLSQKLRSVSPTTIGRVNPVLGSSAAFIKENVTDPVARGLENWSYGDRFLGAPANAPMVNSRTMDMLSALPLGLGAKGVAATAQLVPARPLFNADATAAKRLAERIRQANDAEKQGATDSEIWQNFKLDRAPGLVHPQMMGPNHAKWLEEINPENLIKPGAMDLGLKHADQVLDAPELFRQYPHLRDIQVENTLDNKRGAVAEYSGYKGPMGKISMYLPSLTSPDTFGRTFAHELSHGVMQKSVGPMSTGAAQWNSLGHGVPRAMSPEEASRLANIAGLLQADPFAVEKYGQVPQQLQEFLRTPGGRLRNRTGAWDKSAGETIAETVADRIGSGDSIDKFRSTIAPHEMYPQKPLNDLVMDRGFQVAKENVPTDYGAETLANLLRQFKVIP